jgi:translation initiation factor 2 subunit 2
MEDYEKLLNEAYKKVKPIEGSKDRFEIPQVEGHIEGIRTIISNFKQIADYLRRNPEHLEKFLQKELAAPSKLDGDRAIFVKKIPAKKIDEKIQVYAEKYVICKECKKPDTTLDKQGEYYFIHCLACGAKHSLAKI